MKRKLVLVFLLIVMIMVPITMVEASNESSQLEIISLETNNKQLSEGDTFILQVDISGDISKVDKLIAKYRLKDTDKIKELELNYNNKNELWELNFQINEDWEEGLWELYEVNYSLKEDTIYQTLEWQECYNNGNFTVNKVKDKKITEQSINIVNEEESKEGKLANTNTTGNYVKEVDWTSDKRSPQDLGSSIKITANAKGSNNVLYRFQIKKDGVWTTLQDYSEKNTYTWTPDEPGEYLFSVVARDKYTWDKHAFKNKRYTIEGDYVKEVDWTSDKRSPQDLGSSIKITANAKGSNNVLYRFQIKKDGVWTTLQDYSEKNTYTWTPDEPGEYLFSVVARDKYTWDKHAFKNKRYTIEGDYVKEVDWTSDKRSPQDLGSSIKITANAKGSNNVLYRFQIKKDGVWTTLQDYSEKNTYTWTPDEPGEYLFSVVARDKYTWDKHAFKNKRYTIEGDYVKEVDWTSDKRSPQDLGSSIKITANAKGSNNVLYRFQIKKDGVWTTLQDYSEKNTYTWTPDEPGEYLFSVVARDKYTWDKHAFKNKRYTIEGDYVKEVDWTSDKRSPQDLGSSIKITANAKGSNNVLYRFQIRKDGVWTTLQDYSEKNTYTWTPDEPGEYLFSVVARDKYTWDKHAFKNKRYTINSKIDSKNSYYITYYDKLFEDVLNIQMSKNPLTDLYGGGWKSAKREDVAYYLNSENFLQFIPIEEINQTKTVKVTASTLNVRSQPTINSNILTQIYNGSRYKVLAESNGWYKINANGKTGWIYGEYVVVENNEQGLSSIQVTADVLNIREKPNIGSSIISQTNKGSIYIVLEESNGWYKINSNGKIGWINGEYVKLVNDFPREMYQFLVLSGTSGISTSDLNKALLGKGILEGKGQAFIDASKQHNINELYLVSHAFLETGDGKSKLATGVLVDKVDGKAVEPKIVYNMFGIGAFDSDPTRLGAEKAYKEGWFTPEAAIIGGAKFISESYINNPNYKQDTLYKMRWNPANPGTHQYATDIGWALKQTKYMDIIMEICAQSSSVALKFDIPKYAGSVEVPKEEEPQENPPKAPSKVSVFLDAGHGGKDPGAQGNGLNEKDITLSIALKTGKILENHNIDVKYSRTTDVFVELADRASMANNANSDIFVSFHCNSFTDSSAKGTETYHYPGSAEGAKLAKAIQNSIIKNGVYNSDRGVKENNFKVLKLTKMPAALVETAFISNSQDANILKNRQDEMAKAIAMGILDYLEIPYNETSEGLYRVQTGAFSQRKNAQNLADELKAKGYEAIIVEKDGIYKVQVGAFSQKVNADKLAEQLKADGFEAIVVK